MQRFSSLLQRLVLAAFILALLSAARPYLATAQQADEVGVYLTEIHDLARSALEESHAAQNAATVADVKRHADAVFETIWGIPSGLVAESSRGAERAHGWKTRWQVSPADFDSAFAARYGTEPPEIQDPSRLGIVGRGRHVRNIVEAAMAQENTPGSVKTHGVHVVSSLNNVIGWMKMDDGVTKGERQPRVDLTREWDSPIEFWMSTSDTGWLHEVYSQALNILKTNYDGDVEMARDHAAGLTLLLTKALDGVDANNSGSVEPIKMEGGIATALQHAGFAGYVDS